MKQSLVSILMAATVFTNSVASPAEPTMAEMQWHRRVLVISTADANDPQFLKQQQALSQWTGGDDRDVTLVRIEREVVYGSRETAADLRGRYHLSTTAFSAVLIGKDGHVALRSRTAVSGTKLDGAIDAMPMRKAGQR